MVTLLPFRSITKNRQILPLARQSFHPQKITGTLKMNILLQVQPIKMFFLCPFRETVKISEALRQAKKQQYQSEMSELGSFNNLAQHEMCLIF